MTSSSSWTPWLSSWRWRRCRAWTEWTSWSSVPTATNCREGSLRLTTVRASSEGKLVRVNSEDWHSKCPTVVAALNGFSIWHILSTMFQSTSARNLRNLQTFPYEGICFINILWPKIVCSPHHKLYESFSLALSLTRIRLTHMHVCAQTYRQTYIYNVSVFARWVAFI